MSPALCSPPKFKGRPTLFGQDFAGLTAGHELLIPDGLHHYDLHAWLYKKNPSGVFNRANPDVDCTKGAIYPLRDEPPRKVPPLTFQLPFPRGREENSGTRCQCGRLPMYLPSCRSEKNCRIHIDDHTAIVEAFMVDDLSRGEFGFEGGHGVPRFGADPHGTPDESGGTMEICR
jgi:hypothetical protein